MTRQPPISSLDPAPEPPALKLFVKGFRTMERQLLNGFIMVSRRRTPRLELLSDDQDRLADVVMIDALEPQAMAWARGQTWLDGKAVIWVDGLAGATGHMLVKRPVQWTILPILLARALEQGQKARADAAVPLPSPVATVSSGPSSGAVLVVDDSHAARTHLRLLLEARGIRVDEAASGEAGIRAAASNAYACILMDVLMAGIDGYEACRAIKSSRRSGTGPAVVMLTSRSSPFDRIRGRMAGCDAYLTKPVDPQQLYESIARHGGAPPAAAATALPRDWPRLDAKAGAPNTGRAHGSIALIHQGTLP
jgi:twitching motility two-component system response regulator PilG